MSELSLARINKTEHYDDARKYRDRPGAWRLTHVPTGKFLLGTNARLLNYKQYALDALAKGIYSNKNMQALYDQDPTMKYEVRVTSTMKEAKRHESSERKKAMAAEPIMMLYDRQHVSQERRAMQSRAMKARYAAMSEEERKSYLNNLYNPPKPVIVDGVEFESVNACARHYGVSMQCVSKRIKSPSRRFASWQFKD